MSAYPRDGVVVVQLPARLDQREEERLIADLVAKVTRRHAQEPVGDHDLLARAATLADAYVDGVRPVTITWSTRMRRRYGSCTPADGSMRISRELLGMPEYVLDYVIVHELAHLLVPDHSPAFHELVARFPDTERATAYLDGYAAGQGRAALPEPDSLAESDGAPPAF